MEILIEVQHRHCDPGRHGNASDEPSPLSVYAEERGKTAMRNISRQKIVVLVSAVFAVLLFAAPGLHAQWVTATIPAGTGPNAVAVNPATNMIYVVNGSDNVTVINGATNLTSTVTVGSYPIAIAVNPLTNTIYVANHFDGTVDLPPAFVHVRIRQLSSVPSPI
jgi:YVTN family beta-propeller protein